MNIFKETVKINNNFQLSLQQIEKFKILQDFDRDIKKSSENVPLTAMDHNNYGNLLCQLYQFNEACHQYEEAIALDPQNALFRHNYAKVLHSMNEFNDSCNQHRQSIKLISNVLEMNAKLPKFDIENEIDLKKSSNKNDNTKNSKSSNKKNEKLLKQKKLNEKYHFAYARCLERMFAFEEALSEYHKVILLNNNNNRAKKRIEMIKWKINNPKYVKNEKNLEICVKLILSKQFPGFKIKENYAANYLKYSANNEQEKLTNEAIRKKLIAKQKLNEKEKEYLYKQYKIYNDSSNNNNSNEINNSNDNKNQSKKRRHTVIIGGAPTIETEIDKNDKTDKNGNDNNKTTNNEENKNTNKKDKNKSKTNKSKKKSRRHSIAAIVSSFRKGKRDLGTINEMNMEDISIDIDEVNNVGDLDDLHDIINRDLNEDSNAPDAIVNDTKDEAPVGQEPQLLAGAERASVELVSDDENSKNKSKGAKKMKLG